MGRWEGHGACARGGEGKGELARGVRLCGGRGKAGRGIDAQEEVGSGGVGRRGRGEASVDRRDMDTQEEAGRLEARGREEKQDHGCT